MTEGEGVHWGAHGAVTLTGAALRAFRALEAILDAWCRAWPVEDLLPGPYVSAIFADRCGYLAAFPHLATFAVGASRDALADGALPRFDGQRVEVRVGPVQVLLAPAACHHIYAMLEGQRLSGLRHYAVQATCHRAEDYFQPLVRQAAFTMREVVALGPPDAVDAFIEEARVRAFELLTRLGLDVRWAAATDPFFGERDGKLLMQRIAPNKWELLTPDNLALCSLNNPGRHFGSAFGIEVQGAPMHSACIGFGLERCLSALARRTGGWTHLADELCR